jgi:hypothetical protein
MIDKPRKIKEWKFDEKEKNLDLKSEPTVNNQQGFIGKESRKRFLMGEGTKSIRMDFRDGFSLGGEQIPTAPFSVDMDGNVRGITMLDAANIVLNTTTGTKIGTATGQKLGFYNKTPVDQPITVADAVTQDITGGDTVDKTKTTSDLTSCKNAINAIIDRLQELGLIA